MTNSVYLFNNVNSVYLVKEVGQVRQSCFSYILFHCFSLLPKNQVYIYYFYKNFKRRK